MLRLKLKLYTYHSFLVIPFIVLFLYVHNQELTKPYMTYRTLWMGTCFCLLIYGLIQLFYKNRLKTGVFVTFVLFGLFQYGVCYELLESFQIKGYWPFSNIHRYLIIFYGLLFIGLFVFIKRTAHDFIRINYFLNFLIILLIGFNLLKLAFSTSSQNIQKEAANEALSTHISFKNGVTKPDIYYIILDGYASDGILKKYYRYDNSAFRNKLKQLHFHISDSAFSNYYNTTKSLASTLNLNYINESGNSLFQLRNNLLLKTLKENDYRIYHLRSGYVVTSTFTDADSSIKIGGPNEFEKSLLKHTILRLDDLVGFFAIQRLNSQFKKMYELADIKTTPKFCFLHFVAPHPPFVFERDGKIRTKHLFDEHLWEPENFYIDQLAYVSQQIEGLLDRIVQNDPDALIILQSDHGPFTSAPTREAVFEARSGILYAYRGPDTLNIPNKTSSVNTFRYLLNALFQAQLPLLPDLYAGKELLMKNAIMDKKMLKKEHE